MWDDVHEYVQSSPTYWPTIIIVSALCMRYVVHTIGAAETIRLVVGVFGLLLWQWVVEAIIIPEYVNNVD